MQSDLISVLVVAYNSEETILDTLESIEKQTYSNLEIIVADDHSTDNTATITRDWAIKSKTLKNVKIVSTDTNCGIVGNCNNALKEVSGEYIKFLAADDCLLPNAIEIFYAEMQIHSQDVILHSQVIFMNQEGIDYCLEDKKYSAIQKGTYDLLLNPKINQYKKLLRGNFLVAPAVGLLRRKFLEQFNGFDERFPMMEDYPFFTKLASYGIKFQLIEVPLVKYRVRESSVSQSGGGERYKKSVKDFFYKVRLKAMIKNFMWVSAGKQLVRMLLKKY